MDQTTDFCGEQGQVDSQRKSARALLKLLRRTEAFILLFYVALTLSALGGEVFFVVRHMQGHRYGLMMCYLSMLFVISLASFLCHAYLIKRRLDQELTDSTPRDICGPPPSHMASCLKILHAYSVFVAVLLVSVLVLFDFCTGYTLSHFRPAHAVSTAALATFQCALVVLACTWFVLVLSHSISVSDEPRFPRRSRSTRALEALGGTASQEKTCSQDIVLSDLEDPVFRTDAIKKGAAGVWDARRQCSDISTACPFAPGRNVSSQWGDSEAADAHDHSNGVQPCVIGLPSFTVVRAAPAHSSSEE